MTALVSVWIFQRIIKLKLQFQGMFISDALQPVCVLVKKEEGFYTSNIHKNDDAISVSSRHSSEQFSGQ